MDSVEIRERRPVSVEKKECTLLGALFLFGDILQFTPLESHAVYSAGMKVISLWKRTRGLMPRVSRPVRGPKVF
jgi:hypothetical protein